MFGRSSRFSSGPSSSFSSPTFPLDDDLLAAEDELGKSNPEYFNSTPSFSSSGSFRASPVQRLEAEAQKLSSHLNQSVSSRIIDPLMAKLRTTDMKEMFDCCTKCTQVPTDVSFNATQECVSSCQAPFQAKMNQLQESAQRIGRQASECVQELSLIHI